MKAIYSFSGIPFVEKNGERYAGGFKSSNDFIACARDSVEGARLSFSEINLYVDSKGEKILAPLLNLFDNVFKIECDVNEVYFFAQSKIQAYLQQKEPFIHLDFDLILHQKVDFSNAELIVEFPEYYKFYKEKGYAYLLGVNNPSTLIKDQFLKGIKNPFAYCTGVFGGSDLQTIHEYANEVLKILEDINDSRMKKELKLALWVEQGVLAAICSKYNKQPLRIYEEEVQYTHYNGFNKLKYNETI